MVALAESMGAERTGVARPASVREAKPAQAAPPRYPALDALRAVAALSVIVYHAVLLNKLGVPAWSGEVIYRLGLAVPLFYVLSAFALAVGYHGRLTSADALVGYALRRFFRIAPLFYALIPVWLAVMWFKFGQATTPFVLVANVTFLFGLVPGVHESLVWAGWSVGVEMLFYALLPLVFLVTRGVVSSLVLYLASLVAAVAFQAWIGPGTSYAHMNLVSQLPHFLLGLVAFQAHRSGALARLGRARLLLAPAGLAIWPMMAVLGLSHLKVAGVDVEQYLIALAFPLVVLGQVGTPSRALVNRVSLFLGQRSFSLYLLHPLMIVATMPLVPPMVAALGGRVTLLATPLLAVALTVAAACVTYPLIEVRFMRLGGRLEAPVRRFVAAWREGS